VISLVWAIRTCPPPTTSSRPCARLCAIPRPIGTELLRSLSSEAPSRLVRAAVRVELDPGSGKVMALIGSKGIGHIALRSWIRATRRRSRIPLSVYGVSTRLRAARPSPLRCRPSEGSSGSGRRPGLGSHEALWAELPDNPRPRWPISRRSKSRSRSRAETMCCCCTTLLTARSPSTAISAPSVLQVPVRRRGARIRIDSNVLQHERLADGWVVGSSEAIEALAVVKTNLDSGQFTAIQRAAIGLEDPQSTWTSSGGVPAPARSGDLHVERPRMVAEAPLGSCYVWVPVPRGYVGRVRRSVAR